MKVCPNCQSRFDQGEAYCPDDGTELVEAEELSPGRLAGRTLNETVEIESLRRVDDLGERYRGALVDPETPVDVTVFNQAATPVRQRLDELAPTVEILEKALPPQILSVHSVELDSEERYLVEQAADGQPLRELIDEQAPLDWRQAIRLTARLAQALHWMAERGHIHRGLHPGAVHVDTDESAVQVGDWLQSALTRHTSPLEGAENGQAFVGFAAYMPPEAIEEDGDVDERSLVYSLGMLLYEMVLGRPPFTADDTGELLKRQLHENPLELGVASDDEDLHPELDSILGMMWSKDPEERFQTPKAIVAALSSLVDDSPRELAPAPEVADEPIFETDIDLPDLDGADSGDDSSSERDERVEADGGEDNSDSDTLIGISATDVKEAGPGDETGEADESDDTGDAADDDQPDDDIQAGEAAIEDENHDRERTSSTDQPSIIIEDPELRSAMDEESTVEAADDGSDEETDSEASGDDDDSDDDAVESGESEVSTDAAETDDLGDEGSDVEAAAESDEENIDADGPDEEATSAETDGKESERESADETADDSAEAPDGDESEAEDAAESDEETETDDDDGPDPDASDREGTERDDASGDEDVGQAEDDSDEAEPSDETFSFVTVEPEDASATVLQRTETPAELLAVGFQETEIDETFRVGSETSPVAAEATHFLDDDTEADDESAAWDELSDEIDQDEETETDEEVEGEAEDTDEEPADRSADESSGEAEDEEQTTDEPDDTDESADEDDSDAEPEEEAEDSDEDDSDAEPEEEAEDSDEDDQPADVDQEEADDSDESAEEDEQSAEEPAEDARDERSDDGEADGDEETDETDDDEQTAASEDDESDEQVDDEETAEGEQADDAEDEEAEQTTEDEEAEQTAEDEGDEESSVETSGETVVVDSDDQDEEQTDDEEPERAADEEEAEDEPQLSSFEADGLPETDATDEWFEVDEKEAWRAADVREGRDRSEIMRKYATTAVWVILVLAAVGLFIFAQTYEPADGQDGGSTETQTSSE